MMKATKISVSPLARAACDFEAAILGIGLTDATSAAILRGVSRQALELAKKTLKERKVELKEVDIDA